MYLCSDLIHFYSNQISYKPGLRIKESVDMKKKKNKINTLSLSVIFLSKVISGTVTGRQTHSIKVNHWEFSEGDVLFQSAILVIVKKSQFVT